MVWLPKIGGKYWIVDHFYGLFFFVIPVTLIGNAHHGRYTVHSDPIPQKDWTIEEYTVKHSELYRKLDDALQVASKRYTLEANSVLTILARENRGFRCQECTKISVLPKVTAEGRVCAHCGGQVRPMIKQQEVHNG